MTKTYHIIKMTLTAD